MHLKRFYRTLSSIVLCSATLNAHAATTLVAVASNFTKPMQAIAAAFTQATGHSANLSFGASGKFVAQMENGAPFEVFLSADDKNPQKLALDGYAIADSQFTYAIGKLVLWSATPGYVDNQGAILQHGDFKHLALADPKLAPYGAAAVEVLQQQGVFDKLQPRLVHGENIAQTQQFISTGNAELGFIALAQVFADGKISSGSGWIVPADQHKPIRQDAILLKTGQENPAARALLDFLKSPAAVNIIRQHGYALAL